MTDSADLAALTERCAELEQQVAALTAERDRLEAVIADTIDRLDKHCRALHLQRTTSANLADLVDAICETDERHVQEKQQAERRVERLKGALRFVEYRGEANSCPACGFGPPEHVNDCPIAAALDEASDE